MKSKRQGRYWLTAVHKSALNDAKNVGLSDALLTQLVEQFHSLGDIEDPTMAPGVTRLREYKLRVLRQKTKNPLLLSSVRGLILQVRPKGRGELFLVGIFSRSPETYHEDVPARMKELGLVR